MGFRLFLSYENLILDSVPASGHRDTEDGHDGGDGDDEHVGDDADEVTMVQNYEQSRTRSTDPVSDLPAHNSCLLEGPPPFF